MKLFERVGSSSVVLLAVLFALSSAAVQEINAPSGGEPHITQGKLPDSSVVASGSSDGAHKKSAFLTNFPSVRQSIRPEFQHRPNHNRPGYRHEEEQPLTPIPLVRSFQAASYVHDDVPSMIFINEKRRDGAAPLLTFLTDKTATQTERSKTKVPLYFAEHDEHHKLTDNEQRVKIYYNDRAAFIPPIKRWKKLDEAHKKQNRFFNYSKTRGGKFDKKK